MAAMAPLSEALLEAGERGRPGASSSVPARYVLASVVGTVCGALLLCSGVFLGGAEFGRTTPHTGAAYGVSLKAFNASRTGAPTSLSAGLNADCYTFTGGTCHIDPCDAKRGAQCEDGLCMCVASGCAGVDGVCHNRKNAEVAADFTLTNVKFDWQKMYMPASDPFKHVKTTAVASMFNFGQDKWILHRLPGDLGGNSAYFLSTVRYPDYVAAAQATLGTAISPFGAYEVGLDKEKAPDSIAVRVCSRQDGSIMIGSVGLMGTQWFYLHHGTWEVFTWSIGDPGPGAYWKPDPPIEQGVLEPCGVI